MGDITVMATALIVYSLESILGLSVDTSTESSDADIGGMLLEGSPFALCNDTNGLVRSYSTRIRS